MKRAIKQLIESAIKKAYPDIKIPDFGIEEADAKFGDYSTNIAMVLAKTIMDDPQKIAEKLIRIMGEPENQIIEKAEVAGPGFINFKINPQYLNQKINEIIKAKDGYGASQSGDGKKVNIEFISANPTGPLTVGNSRGGIIGDVLANVFEKTGWAVTREYYFNDAGGQIDVLGHSVLKDDQAEYKGQYIDKLHEQLDGEDFREIGKNAAAIIISEIKKTTKKMGIKFDVWFAEGKDLRDKNEVSKITKWLKDRGLAYVKDGALWFKSTKFDDDKDRVLVRSNGEPTYFCVDCAYHNNKFVKRKFDRVLDIWGADHHGDIARVKGFITASGYEEKFEIIVHQFVRIIKDGKEVRMSKRTGNYVTVEELLDEVGKDVYRFFMLSYAPNTHMDFDLDLAKERSQKNPVFYVQYAYTRIASILKKSEILNSKTETNSNLSNNKVLDKPEEIKLIKELIKLPEIIQEIANDYQVQRLPLYARNLAESFHHFYEKCPVNSEQDHEIKMARIQLLLATQIVLKKTLDLMGVSSPERM